MEKPIKDFENYSITTEGLVISYNNYNNISSNGRIMSTKTPTNKYESVKLSKNNQTYTKMVHRLVAEAFIPNPTNKPVVNHIDGDIKNNKVENLEWVTIKENVNKSYTRSGVGPNRNGFQIKVKLFNKKNEVIGEFESINSACRYASKNFNCSYSGMNKNHKSKGYYILKCND